MSTLITALSGILLRLPKDFGCSCGKHPLHVCLTLIASDSKIGKACYGERGLAVRRLSVAQEVGGSIPLGHPKTGKGQMSNTSLAFQVIVTQTTNY